MFGDNPFAVPISSFQRPVPLVLVDPDDEPDYNVCFRKEWLPYILGSLQQLWLQTTWDTTDPDALALVQNRAKLLTSMFTHECQTCEADIPQNSGCVEFLTNSSIISYAPQDPFVNPDYIPPGYIAVPFLVVEAGSLLSFFPGAQVGDVISGYFSIPILTPGIGQGLARFRVRTKGTGVVELHLLRFPGAGSVLITNDDDPFTVRTINLNKDIVQLPVETVGEVVVEVPINTPGEHHIDVTFVPRFNDELLFLSYGGGVRSVVLCGFDQTLDEAIDERARRGVISIDEEPEMGLRISPDDPCVIQRECAPGEWVNWYDPRACIPGQVSQPAPSDALAAGECRTYHVALRGNDKWLLPLAVQAGTTIEVSNVSGGWSDGSVEWFCPNGQTFTLNACIGGGGGAEVGDPLQLVDHMRLIAQVGADYFDAYNTAVPVTGSTDVDVFFQANDGSLADNQGSITFDVTVCNTEASGEWVFRALGGFDNHLKLTPFSFEGAMSTYDAGLDVYNGADPGDGALRIGVRAQDASPFTITKIQIIVDLNKTDGVMTRPASLFIDGTTIEDWFVAPAGIYRKVFNWEGSEVVNTAIEINGGLGATYLRVSYWEVRGTGFNPFA